MSDKRHEVLDWIERNASMPGNDWRAVYCRCIKDMLAENGVRSEPTDGSTTPDLKHRLDRIEARQILLYEKLAGIRSPLTSPARHDLVTEWNAAAKP